MQNNDEKICGFISESEGTQSLEYILNEKYGTYSVKTCGKDEVNVVVPSEYQGQPVTGIGDYAFAGCENLVSITLPNSLLCIYPHAFEGCSSLNSIDIPNSVTNIKDYAFHDCNELKNVTIPASVTNIGYYAFANCTKLTNVTIPNSVTLL